ncbi:hypothetical protein P3L10_019273 [Capsicum annuum]
MFQLPWSKPPNKYLRMGNLLCSFHFHFRPSAICPSHWKYADMSAVLNNETRRNEGEKERCRTVDITPVTTRETSENKLGAMSSTNGRKLGVLRKRI